MMTNRTFTIIKPNAVAAGNAGKIIDAIIEGGFRVIALRLTYFSRNQAERFYAVHKGKPFFNELVDFMTSGPVYVGVVEHENAVAEFRRLIGATDPAKADEGTIRRRFGESLQCNAIHGSDSDENARIEWSQFFSDDDIIIAEYR
ncbi:MAG: nucleoside-diphosphate kinase [Alistipes sp.]|nr:nucleoside-diphosphate kinase [Alistipes sp.]MDE7129270.1 nucleoside-diphosphate kinase [Alistipes sp.]